MGSDLNITETFTRLYSKEWFEITSNSKRNNRLQFITW